MAIINGDGKTKKLKGAANEENIITGSDIAEAITGGILNDTITGGKGNDTITGGTLADLRSYYNLRVDTDMRPDGYTKQSFSGTQLNAGKTELSADIMFNLKNDKVDVAAISSAVQGWLNTPEHLYANVETVLNSGNTDDIASLISLVSTAGSFYNV